ncbi:hypothetical protein SKAU_G00332400 [Synaphobranchus kaupii]|uniref:Uncharacterized protein n=1 Tax=Synaphobranchus kaupii TaxID=118154 RepID=A0A9Q1IIQ2_SYNKA|nr:hypothetical protein SKAU_G00332400 [Synaphobranchus kaupii]
MKDSYSGVTTLRLTETSRLAFTAHGLQPNYPKINLTKKHLPQITLPSLTSTYPCSGLRSAAERVPPPPSTTPHTAADTVPV